MRMSVARNPSGTSMPTTAALTIAVSHEGGGVHEGDRADADDLAEHQLTSGDRRQQHFDDARRLLPGHATDHPAAVRLQQQEQGDVDEDGGAHSAAGTLVAPRVEALDGGRFVGHRCGDLVRRQARLCQSVGEGDVGTQHVDHRRQVGVVVGVDRLVDDDASHRRRERRGRRRRRRRRRERRRRRRR